jgi:3'-5' exoribonuclease
MSARGPYINDMVENMPVEGVYLVRDKNSAMTRAGKPYIALNLGDKTGLVKGRIWDNAEALGKHFETGDIVRVKAFAIKYQSTLQLNITAIDKHVPADGSLDEFLPVSALDAGACLDELRGIIDSIGNQYLRALLQSLFADDDFVTAFKRAPAAKSIHHDYLGGLIEHTLNVTRLARDIDTDILLTGAIVHDIGKTRELSFERSFEYTDSGRLIGHIMLGVDIISAHIARIDHFPAELADIVKHCILSHHGQLEFGSPKRPKIMEAFLLAYLDDIDAKMYAVASFIRQEKKDGSQWTGYHKLFDRYLYTGTFIPDADDRVAP